MTSFSSAFEARIASIDEIFFGTTAADNLIRTDIKNIPNTLVDLINGDDYFEVQAGSHIVLGGKGDDTIDTGQDGDLIQGDDGDDLIYAGGGEDIVYGDSGIDEIYGGDGQDTIIGGKSGDSLYGDNGGDDITGNDGDDLMFGDKGNDSINGGTGDDVLVGGTGSDTLHGGSGNDFFVHSFDDGETFVYDFTKGKDKLLMVGFDDAITDKNSFFEAAQEVEIEHNNVIIRFDDANEFSIGIIGNDISLSDNDFIFSA